MTTGTERTTHPRQIVVSVLLFVFLLQAVVLFGLHLLSVVLGQGGFYPIVLGGDDGKFHYAVAQYMVASGEVGGRFDLLDVSVWPTIMATFIRLTGSDDILLIKQILLLGRILGIAAGLMALEGLRKGNVVPDSPKTILWSRVAVIFIVGLFPSTLIYSFGSLYRDSLIYGFHLLTVALLLQAITDRRAHARLIFILVSLPVLYALYQLRPYAGYSVVLATTLWLLAQGIGFTAVALTQDRTKRAKAVWVTMTALIGVTGPVLWYTRPVQEMIFFRDSYFFMEGSSNLGISFTGKNPVQALPLYLYSWVSNVIGPLIWQIRKPSNLLSFVIEIPILAYLGYGIWRRRHAFTPGCTFLLTHALVWFSMISFINDNLGTAGRLRVVGWQCLFVVFAYLAPRTATFLRLQARRTFPPSLRGSRA